ncbi:MAG: tRNA guanosine(34) transglycosylase Tgt [Candidatus Cloacimonadota bacterium]|nr:MAG: tRNA guanosine(34) transglycosylase Tgt [Candidatus Cloacimonadota bacterium]
MDLKVVNEDSGSQARTCKFDLNGQEVETPLFMPVGTKATVKTLTNDDLEEMGFPIILGNTYHLYLRPGSSLIKELGGLHGFTGFKRKFLTDSGGFQVFSLKDLRKIDDNGVDFRSIIDGSKHRFTPKNVIETQRELGADIIMAFDECPPGDANWDYISQSMKKTHEWAQICVDEFSKNKGHQHLFGIIQGGIHEDLRLESQNFIQSLGFDGIAIGGLSVGETREDMVRILEVLSTGYDPKRLRYLMGVGTPFDFLNSIKNGIDMFDCVMPTRVARHGKLYSFSGDINILNSKYKRDNSLIDEDCGCKVCQRTTKAYLHHLFKSKEFTGQRLASYHNLAFFHAFMEKVKKHINNNSFMDFYNDWMSKFHTKK